MSLKFVPKDPIDIRSIDLDNGLATNRWQAIIWTNADPIHWCIYVALRGDELTHLNHRKLNTTFTAEAIYCKIKQSGTKPNFVAKIWLPNLVYF